MRLVIFSDVLLVAAVDGYSISLLFMVSIQMEILGCRLKSLGQKSVQITGKNPEKPKHQHKYYQQMENMKKCIQLHLEILELSFYFSRAPTTDRAQSAQVHINHHFSIPSY